MYVCPIFSRYPWFLRPFGWDDVIKMATDTYEISPPFWKTMKLYLHFISFRVEIDAQWRQEHRHRTKSIQYGAIITRSIFQQMFTKDIPQLTHYSSSSNFISRRIHKTYAQHYNSNFTKCIPLAVAREAQRLIELTTVILSIFGLSFCNYLCSVLL